MVLRQQTVQTPPCDFPKQTYSHASARSHRHEAQVLCFSDKAPQIQHERFLLPQYVLRNCGKGRLCNTRCHQLVIPLIGHTTEVPPFQHARRDRIPLCRKYLCLLVASCLLPTVPGRSCHSVLDQIIRPQQSWQPGLHWNVGICARSASSSSSSPLATIAPIYPRNYRRSFLSILPKHRWGVIVCQDVVAIMILCYTRKVVL